ncbi:MAG: NAD(+) synthase [Defluviitaleaceae bacterium]|nr:NAD(+) synthase [Defluviitaleaceae bacterium]MCL2274795.1 NAD(+) synthase [Defluviitaleaceae bacterium]
MRDYARETAQRVDFIRKLVADTGVKGIVFANSGGKDATLTGILCKMACDNTVGLILPCGVSRNYAEDRAHAELLGAQFNIFQRKFDLKNARDALVQALNNGGLDEINNEEANVSIAPRLRMIALYTVAVTENRLVAGTGNRSEKHMGYFTKWGDGAFDFNPIVDLTVTEIFEFLRHLKAPAPIIEKAPSAALFEGQTDEGEMGITYASLDAFLLTGKTNAEDEAVIDRFHTRSEHKRKNPVLYGD